MINRIRLIQRFQKLVSFDSPSFGEREVCDFLKQELRRQGLQPLEDDSAAKTGGNCGNVYTWVDGDIALPPLLFCAHMDTVEPAKGKRAVLHTDGRITSEGNTVLGADDLAGIAAIMEALLTLKEQRIPHRPLEILFTTAEEPYCAGIRQLDFSLLQSKQAYVFDLAGPVGTAAYQAPTIRSFTIVFHGKSSHAGFAPEKGIHAIQAAGLAVSLIPCGNTGNATLNIGTISGGTADNIVPDQCTLTGEIRSFSDTEADRQLEKIAQASHAAAEKVGAVADMQAIKHFAPYLTDLEHPVVARFRDACKQAGVLPLLNQTYGGSDNNHLAQQGIQGLVVATAMNSCHSCAEYTTEQELERAASLAYALMTTKEEN